MTSGASTSPREAGDSDNRGSVKPPGDPRGKARQAGLGSFFRTLPGLLTGIAALITAIATAFFGGTQVSARPTPTVTVTDVVTAPPTNITVPSGAQTGGAPSSGSVRSAPPAGIDLSSAKLVTSSVDQLTTSEPQQVGAKTYADAIRFSCSAPTAVDNGVDWGFHTLIYDVAGYSTLDAYIGVPNDASNAAGNGATIKFYEDGGSTQIGSAFTTELDHPSHVHLNLQRISQLEIFCSAANAGSNGDDIDVAIFNGTLTK